MRGLFSFCIAKRPAGIAAPLAGYCRKYRAGYRRAGYLREYRPRYQIAALIIGGHCCALVRDKARRPGDILGGGAIPGRVIH